MPKEAVAILDGEQARIDREYRTQQRLMHELAHLVSFSYHDPQNIPDPPDGRSERSETSTLSDDAQVRGALISMALRSTQK